MKCGGDEPQKQTKTRQTCPPLKIFSVAAVFCRWTESSSTLSNGTGRVKINDGMAVTSSILIDCFCANLS